MRGDERSVLDLLDGMYARYLVPIYQRRYSWRPRQVNQLVDDMLGLVGEGRSHFIGSVVTKDENGMRVLIDGQQRMTTVLLMVAALARLIDGGMRCVNPSLRLMLGQMMLDASRTGTDAVKFRMTDEDRRPFEAVMMGTLGKAEFLDSNVVQEYRLLGDRLSKCGKSADELYDAMRRLKVIHIELDREDDPQVIFESLNSTGLDLTEADKIRNYVLMGAEVGVAEHLYRDYWKPMEANAGGDATDFIQNWMAIFGRKPTLAKLYGLFKKHVAGRNGDMESVLSDMLGYSVYYRQIVGMDSGDAKVDAVLRRLNLFGAKQAMPYFLTLLNYWHEGNIDGDEAGRVLSIFESYLFRRRACRLTGGSGLAQTAEEIHRAVTRALARGDEGISYCDAFAANLTRRWNQSRFPKDDEFLETIETGDWYHLKDTSRYLWDCLENGDSTERVDVVGGMDAGTLTVEHIMPQTLSDEWKVALGDDADEIHERWENSLANLTLTGYNSRYGNRPFLMKRDMQHGFKDSGLRLNRYVASCDAWGEPELEERTRLLRKRFLELWPFPSTGDVVSEDDEEFTLDDADMLPGRSVVSWSLLDNGRKAASWMDAFVGILGALYAYDPAGMTKVAVGNDVANITTEPRTDSASARSVRVTDGVWANVTSSTSQKCYDLRKVMDALGLGYDELTFVVRPSEDA